MEKDSLFWWPNFIIVKGKAKNYWESHRGSHRIAPGLTAESFPSNEMTYHVSGFQWIELRFPWKVPPLETHSYTHFHSYRAARKNLHAFCSCMRAPCSFIKSTTLLFRMKLFFHFFSRHFRCWIDASWHRSEGGFGRWADQLWRSLAHVRNNVTFRQHFIE